MKSNWKSLEEAKSHRKKKVCVTVLNCSWKKKYWIALANEVTILIGESNWSENEKWIDFYNCFQFKWNGAGV